MKNGYKNAMLPPEKRAEILLKEMSLDEKMAQVNGVFPFEELFYDMNAIDAMTPFGIGEVSTLEMRRLEKLEDVAKWQKDVQEIVMKNSPHHIPAIFHMEGLCGAFIQDATSFPSGIGRASGWDPELEEQIAQIVSNQEAACGITHILAPVLDISRDSRMGRQGETYGEDPVLASALGSAYTKGIQEGEKAGRKTESVAKHFLAFHNSTAGIHGTHSDTPPRLLQEIYAKPFQAAISEAGLKGIMPCYCSIDGVPASASYEILTKLLREDMGFDGVCISDYGAVGNVHNVHHVGETAAEAGAMCMKAGMDIELPNTTGYNAELKKKFENGEEDIAILDALVLRVLTAKFRMGLFEHPFALQGEELKQAFYSKEARQISLRSAMESLVLLKNDGTLPLKKTMKKIAVIGPHANSARKFFGGYTHMCMVESTYAIENSIAGVSGCKNSENKEIVVVPGTNIQSDETEEFDRILKVQKPECRSLLEELQIQYPDTEFIYAYGYPIAGEDESGFEEALQAIEEADAAILTLGGKHGTCSMASMGEGIDASDINLPGCQDKFIFAASKLKKPLIGVHFNGRPISSDAADCYLHAILEAWNPSETGAEAITKVLFGEYNPGGKLPLTVAYHVGQIPIYYNHANGSAWHQSGSIGFANYVDLPHRPRYFFGHGLSYTTFEYSELKLNKTEVEPEETICIEAMIKNTGKVVGDEVVQLYLVDRYASMTRPVKELAGFKRITLQPGEAKKVIFEVEASQMAFLDLEMKWKVEKGMIGVEVGSSSEDIRLNGEFEIKNSRWISGKDRGFYAKVKTESETL